MRTLYAVCIAAGFMCFPALYGNPFLIPGFINLTRRRISVSSRFVPCAERNDHCMIKRMTSVLTLAALLCSLMACSGQTGVSSSEDGRQDMGIDLFDGTRRPAEDVPDGTTAGGGNIRTSASSGPSSSLSTSSSQRGPSATTRPLTKLLSSQVQHWFESPLTDVFKTTKKSGDSLPSAEIHMGKNESESIQVAFRAPFKLTGVEVYIEAPAGAKAPALTAAPIKLVYCSTSSIDLGYKEDYLRFAKGTDVPEYYENSGFMGDVEKNTSFSILVEATSVKSTAAGTYKANLVIVSDQGYRRVPVTVTVYNAVIPDPADSKIGYTAWFSGYLNKDIQEDYEYQIMDGYYGFSNPENMWKYLENVAAVMKKQRHNTIQVPLQALLAKGLTIKSNGEYVFDWTEFDRYVNTFIKYGSVKYLEGNWLMAGAAPEGSMGATTVWVFENKNGKVSVGSRRPIDDAAAVDVHLKSLLKQLYAHLVKKGWDKMWLQKVCDEPPWAMWEEVTSIYRKVQEYMPTCQTFDAGSGQVNHFGSELNIPVAQLDSYHASINKFKELRANGTYDQVWIYTCVNPQGNYMQRIADYPLLSTRIIGWYMWQHDIDGFLHWAWNRWYAVSGGNPYRDLDFRNVPGDGWLVYPDGVNLTVKEGPRATAVRDCFEDYEFLALAAARNPSRTKQIVNSLITSAVVFERDPAVLMQKRLEILKIAAGLA